MMAGMEYLIRFTQVHESFRVAELEALAELEHIDLEVISYSDISPYCIVKLSSNEDAIKLVQRSILVRSIYEIWGMGPTYDALHEDARNRSQHMWERYKHSSFRFTIDAFQGSRTEKEQRELINGFRYLDLQGPVRMKNPDQDFYIMEDWSLDAAVAGLKIPKIVYLGRFLAASSREIIVKYDLKKRNYISTTSMDSELALVTANICLASTGKLMYDPFVGTGSFPIACAHFGATVFGSDIDGRSIRGKGKACLITNFKQYDLTDCFGDSFIADLTNTPVRAARIFDAIVCDPPYGIREGLKVLGSKDASKPKVVVFHNGEAHHLKAGYIPPKKPYSFLLMLDDILDYAALSLVENGRLSFWMPTSNDEEEEIFPPLHPCLKITSVCTQSFNRWSRRLITYRRLQDSEVPQSQTRESREKISGIHADDLNPFRKRYFEGFK